MACFTEGRIARIAGFVEPDALLFPFGDDKLCAYATLCHLLAQRGMLSFKQIQNFTSGKAPCGAKVFEEFFGLANGAVKSDKS